MNTHELIEQLENRFGNPLGPKQYAIVREVIDTLRKLVDNEVSQVND